MVNLSKLFETQRVLDERIMEQHPELKGQNNLDWKILALQVELGECANEWRGFKKWSNDQEPRVYDANPKDQCQICKGSGYLDTHKDFLDWTLCKECDGVGFHFYNPLLEEYVDCLHFILSIGLELELENVCINHSTVKHLIKQDDVMLNFSTNFAFIYKLERKKSFNWYDSLFERFIVLGFSLGFTWEQVEEAYYAKNKINHERQATGY